MRLTAIGSDPRGAPDVVVVTPSHHCPSGVRMSGERQRARCCRGQPESDSLIVEDDYEPPAALGSGHDASPAIKKYRYERPRLLCRQPVEDAGTWAQASYVVAPREAVVALRRLRRLMLRHAGKQQHNARWHLPAQGTSNRCNATGHAYQVRLKLPPRGAGENTADAWQIESPGRRVIAVGATAGRLVADDVVARARDADVVVEAGGGFFGGTPPASICACRISAIPTHLIAEGVAALADAVSTA